jgi:hypothetical protein
MVAMFNLKWICLSQAMLFLPVSIVSCAMVKPMDLSNFLIELSRRDDMESLMYLLIYLTLGNLPWLNLIGNNSLAIASTMIKEQKMKIKGEELCKDLPSKSFILLIHF